MEIVWSQKWNLDLNAWHMLSHIQLSLSTLLFFYFYFVLCDFCFVGHVWWSEVAPDSTQKWVRGTIWDIRGETWPYAFKTSNLPTIVSPSQLPLSLGFLLQTSSFFVVTSVQFYITVLCVEAEEIGEQIGNLACSQPGLIWHSKPCQKRLLSANEQTKHQTKKPNFLKFCALCRWPRWNDFQLCCWCSVQCSQSHRSTSHDVCVFRGKPTN